MIKVGIIGCEYPCAAELLRLIINHPDVELVWVVGSSAVAGTRLDSLVTGIIGECDLVADAECNLENVDLVYLCGSRETVSSWLAEQHIPEGVHLVDLSGGHNLDHGLDKPWRYGLSEMQRRVLVHDSPWVTLPGQAAAAALLALMPMARNLLLNSPLELRVAVDQRALSSDGHTLEGMEVDDWAQEQCREVDFALRQCQSSFNQPMSMTVRPLVQRRTLAAEARFRCGIDGDTINQLYRDYYEDHNFVFIVDRPVEVADVENTNKCLLFLEKDEQRGELTVHAVMDALLKGSAGNAVHVMNLLFGLHERVGLALKATG